MRIALLRRLFYVSLLLLIAGCSGGSCGNGPMRPIAGGYPIAPTDTRVDRAVQARLTDRALRTVEGVTQDLLGAFLGQGITIPRTDQPVTVLGANFCTLVICNNSCLIPIQFTTTPQPIQLAFAGTNRINLRLRATITNRNLSLSGCTFNGNINVDTTRGARRHIGLQTDVTVEREDPSHTARLGYYRAVVGDLTEIPGEEAEDADIDCQGNDGWSDTVCLAVDGLAKGAILNAVRGQLQRAKDPINAALAMSNTPNPPGCPRGTTSNGTGCRFGTGTDVVPLLFGTDGTIDMGALFASITPGLSAPMSFVFAAGDRSRNPANVNGGMNLNATGAMVGGVPDTSGRFPDVHNPCVPRSATQPTIPVVPEFMHFQSASASNIPTTSTQYQVGMAISERFLNHALWHMWDTGTFCLAANTRLSQQLSAGLLTAAPPLSGLRNVIFPAQNSAAAIAFRPQRAPTIRVGGGTNLMTDPLLTVTFQRLQLDFYAWSEERYVRFMTVQTDLTVPMNLTLDNMGGQVSLRPVIGTVSSTNTTIFNTDLVPQVQGPVAMQLATLLNGLLGSTVGMFTGNIPGFSLPQIPVPNPSGGNPIGRITISVMQTGVRGVREGTEGFLGLFADLRYCSNSTTPPPGITRCAAMPDSLEIRATAELERLPIDPTVFEHLEQASLDALPKVRLQMGAVSTFNRNIEYSYRVDQMTWSEWSSQSNVDVQSPSFLVQGNHDIEVRARVEGQPETASSQATHVNFDFDTKAPTVRAAREGNQLSVRAFDEVSASENLQYNITFDGQETEQWTSDALANIPEGASRYRVRVRDESGNIGEFTGEVHTLIIRGGPSTDPGSGCSCTAGSGASDKASLATMLFAFFAGLLVIRFRARKNHLRQEAGLHSKSPVEPIGKGSFRPTTIIVWGGMITAVVALGCDCGAMPTTMDDGGVQDTGVVNDAPVTNDTGTTVTCNNADQLCPSTQMCVPGMDVSACMCNPGFQPMGAPRFDTATCTWDTGSGANACNCQPMPPIPTGMAGSFLDMAVHTDNTVWLSAYSAGDAPGQIPYGDLVVGRWNATANRVDWTHVDGVPQTGDIQGDPGGWRGGNVTPGDDVGRWSSIALTAAGQPRVAYWDTTNNKLKFASYNGTTWTTHVVDTAGNNGRFASLVLLANDVPAIAYRSTVLNTAPGMTGRVLAKVRYARANNANPAQASDWTIIDVDSVTTQCRAEDCRNGQVCSATTGQCSATTTCTSACPSGQACIANACQAVISSNWIDDFVPGTGLFCSLALDSSRRPQLVYYNRDRGNLMGAQQAATGTTWTAPFIIDGEMGTSDRGDRGAWASLAIGTGDVWHVTYIDGSVESLMYTTVTNRVAATPVIVDDGISLGTMATEFTDGRHLVGDSASIAVTGTRVDIVYQDSTAGTLRAATRTGTTGAFTRRVFDMVNHTGYWARLDRGQVGRFWRDMQRRDFGVRVTPLN